MHLFGYLSWSYDEEDNHGNQVWAVLDVFFIEFCRGGFGKSQPHETAHQSSSAINSFEWGR